MSSPGTDPGQIDILLEIALRLGETLDLESLLARVIERVTVLLDAERALLALCDEQGKIQSTVLHNLKWDGPGTPLPVSQSMIGQVIRERKPVLVADARQDETFQQHKSVLVHGLRLLVGVPVLARDQVIGVLYVDSRVRGLERVNDKIDLLTALGRLVGTAIENARLFEEQRYRSQLLAWMVHDLRAPLTVISASVEMLQWQHGEELSAEPRVMVADVQAAAQRMARMIESTLQLSRVDAGASAPPVRIDFVSSLRVHLAPLGPVFQRLGLSLEVVPPPAPIAPFETIAERLWVIVDNLIFNAIKHARRGSAIAVHLQTRSDAGPATAIARPPDPSAYLFRRVRSLSPAAGTPFVQVAVHNLGEAVPADLLPRLFRAYPHAARSNARGVSPGGLGLSIVDQCVRNLGGIAWCESTAESGTSFCFTLPLALDASAG